MYKGYCVISAASKPSQPRWPSTADAAVHTLVGRAGYDGAKRCGGSKVHIAVDALGHPMALKVASAAEGDRA